MTWGLHQVTVDVGGERALETVDVELTAGQITAVVGGDGAGKTTLCRTIVGLTRPASGTVSAPDTIGYQSAASGTWPDMTVDENLAFVANTNRLRGSDRNERIQAMLEATDLTAARTRLSSELSGGMRQKLGMAMALLPRPAMLVLDEPTTGVDPVSRTELWALISAATVEGAAVLMTTTYLDEAERAHEIVALDRGRVLTHGDMAAVAESIDGVFVEGGAPGPTSWRRGRTWRTWHSDGVAPAGTRIVEPDLTDLLVAAEMRAE